jgi:hypothetical protein
MSSTEQLKSDIEHTRAELAETVEAIATKLDVKEQAKRHAGGAARVAVIGVAALGAVIVLRRYLARR